MSSKTKPTAMKEEAKPALVPKLRFPAFRDAESWKPVTLQEASTPVTERVGERKLTPVSISAGIGFVRQAEKFGRDISGNQYQLYTLVRDGDFVFNKGNSLKFPQGCVYQLRGWGQVAAPNVFICFRLKKGYSDGFFQQCFEQNQHGRQLKRHITSGARSNGLLNISKETFFGVEIPTPSPAEQQKIAECLSSVDELIAAQARKLDALKTHKKGLMQQLFPREGETQPRLRFPEFQNAGEWETDTLGAVCELYQPVTLSSSQLSMTGEHLVYGANGVIGTHNEYNHEESEIAVTCRGATCGEMTSTKPKSWITGNAMVVKPRTKKLRKDFIFQYFKNHGLKKVISGSAQPQITRTSFAPLVIFFPKCDEQQRIADCLSSLDDLIAAQTQTLEALKTHKQGLMQQLFPSSEEVES
jgi:type I restriction enzyme S subunit